MKKCLLLFASFCLLTGIYAVTKNPLLTVYASNTLYPSQNGQCSIVFNSSFCDCNSDDSQIQYNNSTQFPDVYTIVDNTNLTLNGLQYISTNPCIPLGFKTMVSGNFTFTFTRNTYINGTSIILEDKLTGTTQNMVTNSVYSFFSSNGEFPSRFVIHMNCSQWNGTGSWSETANWSTGLIPTTGITALIESGELKVDQNPTCNHVIVNPTSKLTINKTQTLTVQGNLSIKSDATGTGTLVDSGTVAVTGTTTVQQYITSGRNWYIASPVNATLSNIVKTPLTNKLYNYNELLASWNEITDAVTTLTAMTGYVANVGSNSTLSFVGSLHTGTQTASITRTEPNGKAGFNLIGNPYPSFVNWSAATKTNVGTTIWYRTQNGSSSYVFDTYNATNGLGTSLNGTAVTGFIPPMQAVWVRAEALGTASVSFDNTMRSHAVNGNKLKADTENEIIRLIVSNGANADEMILVFNENAKNELDAWDSPKMSVDNIDIPELYTKIASEKFVINGLESIATNSSIALGFKTATEGTFTISASEISGIQNIPVVLEDKVSHKTQDLTQNPNYSFSSNAVDNDSRFTLHLKNDNVTGSTIGQNDITIYSIGNTAVVSNTGSQNGSVKVFDILGKAIATKELSGTQTAIDLPKNAGIYIVQVKTDSTIETKKIIVE